MDVQNRCEEKMTDMKKVRFCVHFYGNKCVQCEQTPMKSETTTFYQFKKDITSYIAVNSMEMITDIGCPNSVIGVNDVKNFKRNLSNSQQRNLQSIKVDENFKFGPSGPYNCSEKLRFPIHLGSKVFWGEISIVKANIPMLLGNNILKPMGAEFKLFTSGNGILKLGNTEIPMNETSGGHYTIKVSDLGKLSDFSNQSPTFCSDKESDNISLIRCETCENKFYDRNVLNTTWKLRHEVLN